MIIPSFVEQTNQFVDQVPGIVHDLESKVGDITGDRPSEVGDKVQRYLRKYTNDPARLIGPITSIGLNVAGIATILIVMIITAYYMAVRPQPLVDGALRLVPPARRDHARFALERLRTSWVGWLQGVAFDMLISGTLLYIGLTIIGLDFAIVFAVLTALLVVIPFYGSIIGAIPPVLYATTVSPGKTLATLAVYLVVQQVESNVIVPVVMSRKTRHHPAVIAIGVLIVGRLFGVVGLFVAVPIISAFVILVEETWVREIEDAHARRTGGGAGALALPPEAEPLREQEHSPV
jgi:predicted PurR-regulated permease PerM